MTGRGTWAQQPAPLTLTKLSALLLPNFGSNTLLVVGDKRVRCFGIESNPPPPQASPRRILKHGFLLQPPSALGKKDQLVCLKSMQPAALQRLADDVHKKLMRRGRLREPLGVTLIIHWLKNIFPGGSGRP